MKRTTGIPRSFLKTVEKPLPPSADDSSTTAHTNPTSVMVNADGEYVVAQPDQASWESYQKKAASTSKVSAPVGSKELQEKGIECSVCHKLMRDASRTPCCGQVYCEDCIHNMLLESDFVCPNCEAKEILLDSIQADEETRKKVEEYLKDKEQKGKEKSRSPATSSAGGNSAVPQQQQNDDPMAVKPSVPLSTSSVATSTAGSFSSSNPKKRSAEEEPEPRIPRGPAAMRNSNVPQFQPAPMHPIQQQQQQNGAYGGNGQMFNQQQSFHHQFQPAHKPSPPPQQFHNAYNQYPVGMNGMNGMNGGFYPQNGHYGMMGMGGMMNNGMGGPPQQHHMMNGAMGMHGGNPMMNPFMMQQFQHQQAEQHRAAKFGYFPNQQKTVFSEPFPSEEDSPYMRKPVNPHRHSRPKRIRPSDFKALGE